MTWYIILLCVLDVVLFGLLIGAAKKYNDLKNNYINLTDVCSDLYKEVARVNYRVSEVSVEVSTLTKEVEGLMNDNLSLKKKLEGEADKQVTKKATSVAKKTTTKKGDK